MGAIIAMVPDVGLIAFPWYPSLETGRGHDTYTYHLLRHLSCSDLDIKSFPIVSVRRLQEGVNKFEYGIKEALFLSKILHLKAKVYHGISPLGSKTAILAKKHPTITTIHDAIPFIHRRDLRQAYERICIKRCCDESDRIIVSSNFTGDYLRKELKLESKKMKVVRYGVDHKFFCSRKELKRHNKTVFSIIRWGNLEQFLNAFKTVKKEVQNVELLLGLKHSYDGNYRAQIPYLLEKYDLKNSVKVLYDIPVGKLPYYYNMSDVYISASMGGFSLTILEAMACGVPVIAFGLLDVPEYIGNAGILVKPGDFQELADQTIRLLLDQTLNEKLRNKSLQKSLNFSWEKMSLETIEIYKNLL
jgi:glycosyltransferase involved in cell wall biosynthesis